MGVLGGDALQDGDHVAPIFVGRFLAMKTSSLMVRVEAFRALVGVTAVARGRAVPAVGEGESGGAVRTRGREI